MVHASADFQCLLRLPVIQSDKALAIDSHAGPFAIGIIMESLHHPELS
jgi:hypothetical protein